MKKAIVFGANGYLGRHIVFQLKQHGYIFLPSGSSEKSVDGYENYKRINVVNKKELETVDLNVDYIFVFAGLTGTNIGFEKYKDFIEVNEIGLLNILDSLKNSDGNARIIFPSTRLVYKGIKNVFLKEGSEKNAKTIYAQNKLACEGYLKMYQDIFGIDYTIFRICVPYGDIISNSYAYGTLGFFLNMAISGKNITLFGNGSVKRTFTHIEDISEIIIKAINLEKTKNQIYNIGSNDNLSLKEVASLVANKYSTGVAFVDWPEDALKVESGDTIFDGSKLEKLLNYKYKNSMADWFNSI